MNLKDSIEPMSDGRVHIHGLVFTFSVIEVMKSDDASTVGDRDFIMRCMRCNSSWTRTIERNDLASIYPARIPPRSSALTIMRRAPAIKTAVLGWADGHLCMPPGYAGIPEYVLDRINRDATKAEQYDTLACILAELAIAEGA